MKIFLTLISISFFLVVSTYAEERIHDLGIVKVIAVRYIGNDQFQVVLSKEGPDIPNTSKLFFTNNTELAFDFLPEKLEGIFVGSTDTKKGILREDVRMTGPQFINLLISKSIENKAISLSASFTKTRNAKTKQAVYQLSYFQINGEI
jgi:hypothetical protein